MENKILIFGHKNPDTDTICSSMVKQILSKKMEMKTHKQLDLEVLTKKHNMF